jgi:hypothetical protein
MRGYVGWVSGRYGDLARELGQVRKEYREKFQTLLPGSHPRTPDAAAALAVGVSMLRNFAVDVGFMGDTEGDEFAEGAVADLIEAAQAHSEATSGGDPATRFIELLRTLFNAGRAYAKDRETNMAPQTYDELGWEDRENFDGDKVTEPRRGAEFVGWADETFLYLDKDAAYGAVAGFTQRGGIPFGIMPRALWQSLARARLSVTGPGRTDSVARIEGRPKRIVQIARAKMLGGEDG